MPHKVFSSFWHCDDHFVKQHILIEFNTAPVTTASCFTNGILSHISFVRRPIYLSVCSYSRFLLHWPFAAAGDSGYLLVTVGVVARVHNQHIGHWLLLSWLLISFCMLIHATTTTTVNNYYEQEATTTTCDTTNRPFRPHRAKVWQRVKSAE